MINELAIDEENRSLTPPTVNARKPSHSQRGMTVIPASNPGRVLVRANGVEVEDDRWERGRWVLSLPILTDPSF